MKVIQFSRVMAAHILVAVLPCGCTYKDKEQAETAQEAGEANSAGVTFSAKHGLKVAEKTAKFIGLEVADVEERKITSTVRFTAQVFRPASESQFASASAQVSMVALATVTVSEQMAAALKPGQSVSFGTSNGNRFAGTVRQNYPGLGKGGQAEIVLAVQDSSGELRTGAYLSAETAAGEERTAVTVPASALLKTAEATFVYTLSGEHFVRTAVKVGTLTHEYVEITEGLLAGDQIVTKPVMTLWMAELQSIRGGQACADGH